MRTKKIKIFLLLILFAIVSFLFIPTKGTCQVIKTTPTEILQNPGKYDGRTVQVKGTVVSLNFRTSKKGNAYTTFKLKDSQNQTCQFLVLGLYP